MRGLALLHFLFCFTFVNTPVAFASMSPTPSPTNDLLEFTKKPGDDLDTNRLIDQQNHSYDSGDHTTHTVQDNILTGQSRAQQMVDILKDQEMKKALEKVTKKGNEILQQNPELKNPGAVIMGAVSLWSGRTFKLIKEETFKLSSHVEGKSRSGDFSMESPLLNSKLNFTGGDGMSVSMNRSIASIRSSAEVTYNLRAQSVSGALSHSICPHLDLSFGGGQTPGSPVDGTARLQYNLNF